MVRNKVQNVRSGSFMWRPPFLLVAITHATPSGLTSEVSAGLLLFGAQISGCHDSSLRLHVAWAGRETLVVWHIEVASRTWRIWPVQKENLTSTYRTLVKRMWKEDKRSLEEKSAIENPFPFGRISLSVFFSPSSKPCLARQASWPILKPGSSRNADGHQMVNRKLADPRHKLPPHPK